jgi:hypothetical protein
MSEDKNILPSEGDQKPEQPKDIKTGLIIKKDEAPTAKMEVHHHPDIHHKRKKFREYFLEFLMIFLAVSLGFFAESLRENISDHSKEKEYINSLLEDWKEDTVMMNHAIYDACPTSIKITDSLLAMINSKNPTQYANEIYYFTAFVRRRFFHSFQDKTIVQLRNAGGLRLVNNTNAKDSISVYYDKVKILQMFDDAITTNNEKLADLIPQFFKFTDWSKLFNSSNSLIRPADSLTLNPLNADLVNKFSFMLYHYRSFETQFMRRIASLKSESPNMILLIKKEYHL